MTRLSIITAHAVIATLLAFGQAAPAHAQGSTGRDATADPLQEVVVTATKREERLSDIPSSIQVVDAAELAALGADNVTDYARMVAGMSFIDRGPGQAQIAIRGITTGADFDVGPQSTVGVFIDEIPLSLAMAQPDFKLFDLERVEVLRGPQGTLYGSSSVGGAIRYITRKPELENYASAGNVTISNTEEGGANYAIDGMLNVPLSAGRSAARFSAYLRDFDGYVDDIGTGIENVNDERTLGGRAAWRYVPTERMTLDVAFLAQKADFGGLPAYDQAVGELVKSRAGRETYGDESYAGNVTLRVDLGWASLLSASSYFDRTRDYVRDVSFAFGATSLTSLEYGSSAFAQEVRLVSPAENALSWVAGAYYEDRQETYHQVIPVEGIGTFPPLPPDVLLVGDSERNTDQIALFGELGLRFAEVWRAAVGLRWSDSDFDAKSLRNSRGVPSAGTAAQSGSDVTPKFGLAYEPTDDFMLYTRAAKGFRIGGGNFSGLSVVPPTYDSDSLWNYEIGAKASWFDRRLSLNSSIFYIDWKDVQLQVLTPEGGAFYANAGDATSRGAEIELYAYPFAPLSIALTATFLDAKFDDGEPSIGAEPGERLPTVPERSYSGAVEYTVPFGNNLAGLLRVDAQYVGENFNAFARPQPQGDYTLVNFRAGLRHEKWDLDLFLSNAFDERATLFVHEFGGMRIETNRPRTVGVTLRTRF